MAFDFELIGIASALPGYKVAWHLNKALDISMHRITDHVVDLKKTTNNGELSFDNDSNYSLRFSRYSYEIPQEELIYELISYKSQGQLLNNQIKGYDFILKLESQEEKAVEFVTKLNKIDAFSIVKNIEIDDMDLDFLNEL